jgi:Fe-Mn family superoxide dismutase
MENKDSRRDFIRKAALLSGATLIGGNAALKAAAGNDGLPPVQQDDDKKAGLVFEQDPLPYAFDALEPYIDKQTMQIHYEKHHQAYITNLNKALADKKISDKQDQTAALEHILQTVSGQTTAVRNNAGGHWNHKMFWQWMTPNAKSTYAGKAADAINAQFGSFDKFMTVFTDTAMSRFGSGWTWLVKRETRLEIISTPNQDNPLMNIAEVRGKPILGLDVWEHAYYLKYQNLRKDYINNWYKVVNWDKVSSLL